MYANESIWNSLDTNIVMDVVGVIVFAREGASSENAHCGVYAT